MKPYSFKRTDNYDCLVCGKPVVESGVVKAKAARIEAKGYWCWDCIEDEDDANRAMNNI